MADSKIEWTDATWNPVAGCAVITAGCTNCYAMRMAARLEAMGVEKYRGLTRKSGGRSVWTGRVHCDWGALDTPKHWRQSRLVFVNSMSDLFHPDVPTAFIARVWMTMADTPHHTYQILTKRPERMTEILTEGFSVLRNVWLGTSVESRCAGAARSSAQGAGCSSIRVVRAVARLRRKGRSHGNRLGHRRRRERPEIARDR